MFLGCAMAFPALAQWSPAVPLELPAGFDVPLNTTGQDQTKSGALTVNGGYISGPAADLNVNGQICWNGTCQDNWSTAAGGNFVHLFTTSAYAADSGYADLTGSAALAAFALAGKAPVATALKATSGFSGIASATTAATTSVGVFGESQNTSGTAVYGYNGGNANTWAGTFVGKVRIDWPYDLIVGQVGTNAQQARNNTSNSYLCLGGDSGSFASVCRTTWPTGASSLWALNGSTLWPSSTTNNVVAGGTGGSAKFRIERRPDFTTDVYIAGGATATGFVVGSPSSLTPVSVTCGDKVCNGSEVATFGHPNFCAVDCDYTPPTPVEMDEAVVDQFARQVTFYWATTTTDTRGTLVLQKIGSPSASPTDGVVVADVLATSCALGCSYQTPTLSTGITYYYTFFAYDYAPNYSTGVYRSVRFSSGGGGHDPPIGGGV